MADTKVSALSEISVPSLEDLLYLVDDPAGTPAAAKVSGTRYLGMALKHLAQGRLTTESGVPISTSDRTSQSTLYFTPYQGNLVGLYDGTRWKLYTFTERSLALSGLTSGKNYDVFLYDNAGTLTLELSAAWTNDTTRANALALQDGIYVKSGATTRRYLGTIRTTGTTTTEDSLTRRFICSADHPALVPVRRFETTASWSYTTASFRQANGSAANQVEIVAGLLGRTLVLNLAIWARSTSVGSLGYAGIGEDSTTVPSPHGTMGNYYSVSASLELSIEATLVRQVPLGYHVYTWLERGDTNIAFHTQQSGVDLQRGLIGTMLM